jgi:hypothetical protein
MGPVRKYMPIPVTAAPAAANPPPSQYHPDVSDGTGSTGMEGETIAGGAGGVSAFFWGGR